MKWLLLLAAVSAARVCLESHDDNAPLIDYDSPFFWQLTRLARDAYTLLDVSSSIETSVGLAVGLPDSCIWTGRTRCCERVVLTTCGYAFPGLPIVAHVNLTDACTRHFDLVALHRPSWADFVAVMKGCEPDVVAVRGAGGAVSYYLTTTQYATFANGDDWAIYHS